MEIDTASVRHLMNSIDDYQGSAVLRARLSESVNNVSEDLGGQRLPPIAPLPHKEMAVLFM